MIIPLTKCLSYLLCGLYYCLSWQPALLMKFNFSNNFEVFGLKGKRGHLGVILVMSGCIYTSGIEGKISVLEMFYTLYLHKDT